MKNEENEIVHIKCSNCGTSLMDVELKDPTLDLDWVFVVHCDWCGDKSYETTLKGNIRYAGTDKSDLLGVSPDEGVFHWYTKKVEGIR